MSDRPKPLGYEPPPRPASARQLLVLAAMLTAAVAMMVLATVVAAIVGVRKFELPPDPERPAGTAPASTPVPPGAGLRSARTPAGF